MQNARDYSLYELSSCPIWIKLPNCDTEDRLSSIRSLPWQCEPLYSLQHTRGLYPLLELTTSLQLAQLPTKGNRMNIMDMVKKSVSDKVMGQIGGMLGMSDPKKTSSTFDTAIGSILGGMMKKSTTPEGTKQVFDIASNADPSIMDKLGDILGGGGDRVDAVQKSGGGMLEGIFGGNQGGIIQSIAKALGLDGSIVGKLLTLAAPMLLGVIGKHIKSAGMNAVGLGSLLGEQKPHVQAALPSGLTQDLGFGNLFSGAGDLGNSALNATRGATTSASNAASSAANTANDAAKKGGGLLSILLPLIILGAIAYFAYPYIMQAMNKDKDQANVENAGQVAGDLETVDVSALGEAGPKLKTGFTDITSGFKGLAETGTDGANELATKISDFTGSIGNMGLADMPEAAVPVRTSMIGKFIQTVQMMMDKQNDAIKGILQGPVNTLIETLEPFA